MKIAIVAGEGSGDNIAASIIQGVRAKYPQVKFIGLTGPKMRAQGCETIADFSDISVMGFLPVVKKIRTILKVRDKLLSAFKESPPDLFIGVDYTDFNIRLAGHLKKLGIKTVQYKGPSVWAWRSGRKVSVAKNIDILFTIFPFENLEYRGTRVKPIYVGHPLLKSIPININKQLARNRLNISEKRLVLALLPGSRTQEISSLAKVYIESIIILSKKIKQIHVICAHASHDKMQQFKKIMIHDVAIKITHEVHNTNTVLEACDAALITSGTATFEAMLYKKPMVVAYKVSYVLGKVLKKMIKAPYIALPNLLFNKEIVRELKQEEVTPANIANELSKILLDTEFSKNIAKQFTDMHIKLKREAKEDVVNHIQSLIENA